MTHRLTIQIVTWNSAPFLPKLLQSLKQQNFQEFRLTIIDNASSDESLKIVPSYFPNATIVKNHENIGFCAAHNQGIRLSESPCLALMNPDIVLESKVLSILVGVLERHPEIGSVGGKLLSDQRQSGMIDSAGLIVERSWKRFFSGAGPFLNRGEGETDHGQYDVAEEVFANTGACVFLRRDALESIRLGGEYFDEDLFAYKDDVDLGWRLRIAGWRNWYEPAAEIFHRRSIRHTRRVVTTRRGERSVSMNRLSYRNHLLVLFKNARLNDWFVGWPSLLFYELAKAFFLLLFERNTLPGLMDAVRLLPTMQRKHHIIKNSRRTSSSELRQWL